MSKPKKKDKVSEPAPATESARLVARKSFVIHCNEYHREIQAGDDLQDVPEKFHQNLVTEGVLDKIGG